ncbi:MAG: nucleoside kinase [Kiritimatiellia bacterium]
MRDVMIVVEGQPAMKKAARTLVRDVLPARGVNGLDVIAALVNNEVVSLNHALVVNSCVAPLTLADSHGWRVYRWSLGFLLAMAMRTVVPQVAFRVRHSLGNGLYCSAHWPDAEAAAPLAERVAHIEQAMRDLVARDLSIENELLSYVDALQQFKQSGQDDTINLLHHRNPPHVALLRCDGFLDLAHEPIVHRTGLLTLFRLTPYETGFVLDMPSVDAPYCVAPFEPQPQLFHVYQEHAAWGRILGVTTVGQLNESVMNKRMDDIIQTVEALHEKKLSAIADAITSRKQTIRLVLVAGPSCSGKTTFAMRLVSHLRVNGLHPVVISADDYFVGDELNPRDAQGNLDYEHIESMDLARLNRDLLDLLEGRPVHLRLFDFRTKTGRDREETSRLGPQDVIIMEGIHCLNPQLTAEVPRQVKYQIYVSALTQLGVDRHNRISTTDNRLIRRLVRDDQYRGHQAIHTLRRWPSVRQGEQRWIFPYQHLVDATFNSALDYELAVLKPFVVPLLNQIKPSQPEYTEARRLTGFLHNFLAIPPTAVPGNSLLREYIGGSQLKY